MAHVPVATGADAAQPTRRELKRNERRDRVFHAAIALFVERGYDETSMDDIAARANLARTTVFNHFPRKVQFLEEWTLRRRAHAASSLVITERSDGDLRRALSTYLATLADQNKRTRDETIAVMAPTLRNTDTLVDHPLARDLARLVAESEDALRPGVDAATVGRLISLGYFSAVMRWIDAEHDDVDLADELEKILTTILDGALRAPHR